MFLHSYRYYNLAIHVLHTSVVQLVLHYVISVCLFMQGLTSVEEMLILAILPIMTLYRLPHGQYGYCGHVINLPQDIASLANKLPCTPANLDVIVIHKEGAVDHHRDFRVRRSVVLHALQWLTANNMYYPNVTIDHDTLALLHVDRNISGLVTMAVVSDIQSHPYSKT